MELSFGHTKFEMPIRQISRDGHIHMPSLHKSHLKCMTFPQTGEGQNGSSDKIISIREKNSSVGFFHSLPFTALRSCLANVPYYSAQSHPRTALALITHL